MSDSVRFVVRKFPDLRGLRDAYELADSVTVDLSECDVTTRRRAVDFVSGVAYGAKAKLTREFGHLFVLTPAEPR
jgi:FtsZ-interacting cell division protein YlmF